MKFKRNLTVLLSGVLSLMLFAGCSGNDANADAKNDAQDAASVENEVSQPDWETWVYEDEYIRYEMPVGWEKNSDYSSDEMKFSFFIMEEPPSNTPSNVNVQVLNLDNNEPMDYADPAVQEDFHQFLLSEDGVPLEGVEDGTFVAEQINGQWVYSLSFERQAENGAMVRQTAYFPMELDYSIVIWATDFKDNCTPAVEDIAKHICATLEVL